MIGLSSRDYFESGVSGNIDNIECRINTFSMEYFGKMVHNFGNSNPFYGWHGNDIKALL